jgi:hypothetical protein
MYSLTCPLVAIRLSFSVTEVTFERPDLDAEGGERDARVERDSVDLARNL